MSAPETIQWAVLQSAMSPIMTLSPARVTHAQVEAEYLAIAHAFEFGTVLMRLSTRHTPWSAVQLTPGTPLTLDATKDPWERYDFTVDVPEDWPVRAAPGCVVRRVDVRVEVL